jgi:hypothetical protein
MFLKNVEFLSNFISYQISVLPKRTRQTSFLKFLSKIILNFKGARPEILGFRMVFKGRFNK